MLCLYKLIDNLRRFYHLLILHDRAQASLPGFKVLPLHQFGTWGSLITDEFDPEKDTYVLVIKEFLKFSTIFWSSLNNWGITSCCWCCLFIMLLFDLTRACYPELQCHHGVRSLQIAKWLQTQVYHFITSYCFPIVDTSFDDELLVFFMFTQHDKVQLEVLIFFHSHQYMHYAHNIYCILMLL